MNIHEHYINEPIKQIRTYNPKIDSIKNYPSSHKPSLFIQKKYLKERADQNEHMISKMKKLEQIDYDKIKENLVRALQTLVN
jgi:hypothetical protein